MAQDVVQYIRTLQGSTLGDIFKKFSLYVISNNDVISSNLEDLLAKFIPKNNVEKLFRLHLIDKFQRRSEIVRILEEEDIFYITRALNCKWFFTNLEVNPTVLVNEILPNLSYSIRLKLLKKYSKCLKDVNKAEEIYRAVQQRYGIESALTILAACSPSFVKDTLLSTVTQIKPIVIVPLFRLYPEVIIDFFSFILENKKSDKRHYRNFCFDRYSNVFVQFASKYPERFINLYVEYGNYFPYMTLGNRTAKRIIKTNPSVIIKNWNTFKTLLKVKHLRRYMDASQIEELQLFYFPEKIIDFFQLHWRMEILGDITAHMEDNKRQEMLLRNFKRMYNKDFNVQQFVELIDLSLLKLIPIDMRIKWIQMKLPSLETDSKKAEYLSYLPPDIALPALKELLVKQKEFMVRAHMMKCMMLSTSHYKSTASLLDCLSFVVQRLRNDNIRVRDNVFNELSDMKDVIRNLRIDEWSVIDELVDLVRMNDEEMNFRHNLQDILPLKIEKYFSEGIPMEEHLKKYLEFQISLDTYYNFELCKGTKYEKRCFEFFLSAFPSLTFKKKEDKTESESRLFCTLSEYNHLHKNDRVEYPEWLLVDIEKTLMDNNLHYYNKTCLINAIRKQPYLKERIYINVFPYFTDPDVILYILHKKPLLIKEHNETLMKTILNSYRTNDYHSFFKQITLYSSFSLLQTLTNLCTKVLQTENEDSKDYKYASKPNAVLVLSVIMSAKDFIQIITPYKPNKEEIEKYSDENRIQYRIQKAVASSLKHVNTPSEILAYIKTFAVGDYLKLIVGSISSICLRVAEKKILPLLIDWLDCPVSVRKHFIRAYYKVAPIADTGNLIVSLLSKEKNTSLRLLLLQHIYKYFLAEPCEETFAVFKAGYNQLTSEDVAAVDDLFDLKLIPDSFVAPFVKMLWEAVELKRGPLVSKSKNKIINMIDGDILSVLPEEFCDTLLKHVFSIDSLTEFGTFITLYLLHISDEISQMSRLEKFLQYMRLTVQQDWNGFNLNRHTVFQTRDNLFSIIENICGQSIQKEKLPINPTNLLEKLKLFLHSTVPSEDIIDELLRIEVTMFITANSMLSDNFVIQLANFYNEQLIKNCSLYGDQIIQTVVSLMPYHLEKYRLHLAKILLFEHTSYQAHLMALKLINTDINDDISTYKSIVDFILKCNNPYVKAAAGGFLRNLNSNVKFC